MSIYRRALSVRFFLGTVPPILTSLSGRELFDLWTEYENSLSDEAVFVKEVDKLEMLIQAVEYERGKWTIPVRVLSN